jgi:hypothetical protein
MKWGSYLSVNRTLLHSLNLTLAITNEPVLAMSQGMTILPAGANSGTVCTDCVPGTYQPNGGQYGLIGSFESYVIRLLIVVLLSYLI